MFSFYLENTVLLHEIASEPELFICGAGNVRLTIVNHSFRLGYTWQRSCCRKFHFPSLLKACRRIIGFVDMYLLMIVCNGDIRIVQSEYTISKILLKRKIES